MDGRGKLHNNAKRDSCLPHLASATLPSVGTQASRAPSGCSAHGVRAPEHIPAAPEASGLVFQSA